MTFRQVLIWSMLVIPCAGISYADVTSDDIARSLRQNLRHPYLYFTEDEKPAILDRIDRDPACRDIMNRLLAEANRLLYTPVVTPLPRELKDSRFDTSGDFLSVYGQYRRAAYILAFLYQMTGEEKYAAKSFEFAQVLCDMETWVMRACQFAKAYKRVSPWNVTDDKVVFTYAILASDTASDLSAVYDWLYPVLTVEQRDWIRGALMEKAIIQVRGNYQYHWWSTAYRCNWCAWCNTGLGLAALTLLTENPELTDVIAESYNRIGRTFDEIGVDGGWQEGAAYWAQTVRMSLLFMDSLKRLTNGQYDLFKHPKIANNPVNFPLYLSIPPRWDAVNFEDAGMHKVGSPRLYNKLALETGNRESAWILETMFGDGDDIFDIIWPKNTVKPGLPEQTSIHFRTIDWVVMRSDFTDPDKVMVACKAGKNDDPHHGHLDCGEFTVFWHGAGYIADLGTAVYDEKYFDAEKYDTPHASSAGHNLIFVNGEQQIPGKLYKQPVDERIGGKVIEFRPGKDRDYTLMDPSDAYPKKELKKWRRHIILEKPVITVVVDEVESRKGAEIEARFHSDCTQVIRDGYTLLDGTDGDMALIPVVECPFAFRPARHAYLALQKQASFQWIPYNGTVLDAPADRTVIAHIILPVGSDREARAIVKSAKRTLDRAGNYSLSFSANGKRYSYTFKNEPDGLVLEQGR
ncbi:heparinase II/III-family protein [bacterium]|nr:heparinase II/III-family protein [bacterium]